ncbi:MAG: RluA family pseudouridine synthase [Anaerolineaceae bacterium]|nr:RluA family pseudouridine synthase [Anaerolineaceae bacterium]
MKQTIHQFDVSSDEEVRVDKYLAEQLPDISRSQIKSIIEDGKVTLDGVTVLKAGAKAKAGSAIVITVIEDDSDGLVPEQIPLDILYEDEQVIVINKPAGMVVHPGAGNQSGTLVNALLAHYPNIREVGEEDRPGVVHRLDKETSGVILFAKTEKAYKWFVRQFKTRELNKTYLALVDGKPPTPTGRIEAPIERDPKVRTRMAVGLRGSGKPAVTEYYTREVFTDHTLLDVHLITGRTHQIRVHFSYLGIPVVGDTLYGRRNPTIDMDRFFLHAKTLVITLPGERAPRTFEAPLPEDLEAILSVLRENERFQG